MLRPGLNTAKADFHRITKSHNNLDFLQSEKNAKNVNKKEASESSVKKAEAVKERKVNKSSGKITERINRKEANSHRKIRMESNKSMEIKTSLTAEDLDFDVNLNLTANNSNNNNLISTSIINTINYSVDDKCISNKEENDFIKIESELGNLNAKSVIENKSRNITDKAEINLAMSRKFTNKLEECIFQAHLLISFKFIVEFI
jgi:hypothetical protein